MKTLLTQDNIFRRLFFEGNQSCSELSRWSGKSAPSVSKLLNELQDKLTIEANGFAPSTGGRRATRYSIIPDCGYIVAVSMDQLFTSIIIFDFGRKAVSSIETIELDLHHTQHILSLLSDFILHHIQKSGIPTDKIVGVGISMPGLIKPKEGMNRTFFDQQPQINHQEFLQQKIQIPVFIDNDSSLIALAEWTFGKAKGAKNAMIINIGWGTGLGMIVNGEIFRGETGYAGEFSHIPINDNGRLCECGKRGCLETETSLLFMAEEAIKKMDAGEELGIARKELSYMSDEIMEAAVKGNHYCIALLEKIGKALGKGIGILIQIMNPGQILLSGRGAKAEKILKAPIEQAIIQNCIPQLAEKVKLSVSDLGRNAALYGAAALVVENSSIQDYINNKNKAKVSF